jgi:peptidoglycan/xylan/chitin deacetylase (PgdA/CDA1 family)
MKVTTLLYHDVVERGQWDTSGFTGAGPQRYKLTIDEFDQHLLNIKSVVSAPLLTVHDVLSGSTSRSPLFITFDDGGRSATHVAARLEQYGWRGHFFVTTDVIGQHGFLSVSEIQVLRKRGHVIGTHSCSHPMRMADCSWETLLEEWERSMNILSDIVSEKVDIGSVPGGYFSRKVAEAAAKAGMRALFTSEPVRTCYTVNGCLVLGRYFLMADGIPRAAASFATNRWYPRCKQYALWNIKKVAKSIGGEYYVKLRELVVNSHRKT